MILRFTMIIKFLKDSPLIYQMNLKISKKGTIILQIVLYS